MENKKIKFPIAAIFLALLCAWQILWGGIHVWSILWICADLLVLIALIRRKTDIFLPAALAFNSLLSLYGLLESFGLSELFISAAYVLLTLIALCFAEQTLIKADFSRFRNICKKLYWIPVALYSAGSFFLLLFAPRYSLPSAVLNLLACFFLAKWIVDPYKTVSEKPAGTAGGEITAEEGYYPIGKHILLCLFTCGIWYYIWTYRVTKILNRTPGVEQYNPTNKLLLCMFVPFYAIYWLYKHGQRIDALAKSKNVAVSDMATTCLIFGIFVPIVAYILMQDRINTICTEKAPSAPAPSAASEEKTAAETLMEYKKLLDCGAITEEEFEEKKKQLLNI